jgi:ABC-type branched-subunit amino acid transport system ATPase component
MRGTPFTRSKPTPPAGDQPLCASDLRRVFSGVAALAGVDVVLGRAETLGVIGPNGSGKTTLINLLSGTIQPSAGSIWLNQRHAGGWSADRFAREGVARTFQNIRLFRGLTAAENVEVGVAARGRVRRSRAHARARFPTESSAGSRSHGPWRRPRRSSCSTSRPPG